MRDRSDQTKRTLARARHLRRAKASPPQRKQGLEPMGYLAEFTPQGDTPTEPCGSCADSVFWTIGGQSAWRCRTCDLTDARASVQWFVLPRYLT